MSIEPSSNESRNHAAPKGSPSETVRPYEQHPCPPDSLMPHLRLPIRSQVDMNLMELMSCCLCRSLA
jgi:hypothetical protein